MSVFVKFAFFKAFQAFLGDVRTLREIIAWNCGGGAIIHVHNTLLDFFGGKLHYNPILCFEIVVNHIGVLIT